MSAPDNSYLGEVLKQQEKVGMELRRHQRAAPAREVTGEFAPLPTQQATVSVGRNVDHRITGWGYWKTVVVPPNMYVVHTRRGHQQPLHLGMGVSFRFNSNKDAFLIIPAAMQTIVINARCICVERQGILVQAYVQWIIDDISTAYRKLDFSDPDEPMRIVNVQLREQAEAAIKDKVAAMRIDDVLADKQPIIEELTHRLRTVAEGSRDTATSAGLGLKIVTVQIKEAVVSSTTLWQNLQKPFRTERERLARMAELETERQIAERELQIRQARETSEIATQMELVRQHAAKDRADTIEHGVTQKAKYESELDIALKSLEVEQRKVAQELSSLAERKRLELAQAELLRQRCEQETALAEQRSVAASLVAKREIAQLQDRRTVENDISEGHVAARMIAALPEIAAKLPVPKELKSIQVSGDHAISGVSALTGLIEGLLALLDRRGGTSKPGTQKAV